MRDWIHLLFSLFSSVVVSLLVSIEKKWKSLTKVIKDLIAYLILLIGMKDARDP